MTENQRNFFRLDIELALEYQLMDADKIDTHPEDFFSNDPAFLIPQKIALLDRELQQQNPPQLSRESSNYLRLTHKKIDLLYQLVASQQKQQLEQHIKSVSLSESGMAFKCSETWPEKQYLALKIMLLPDCIGLYIKAKVIRIESLDDGETTRYGLEFIDLEEQYRNILARYIMQIQSQQLRQRKRQD